MNTPSTLLLLSLLISGIALSQPGDKYLVKKITIKGAPIESDFSSLEQDADGFMWLGGLNGLYRYDGMRVTRFLRDPSDSNSLTHNYASSLTKDRSGNIWIGTFGGFMNVYDRTTGKIKRIESAVKNPQRIVVRKTIVSSSGTILAATAKGIFEIEPNGVVTDSLVLPAVEHLNKAAITDVFEYAPGQLMITTSTGVFLVNWQKKEIATAPFLPAGKRYNFVENDADGNYWIGAEGQIFMVDKGFRLLTDNVYNKQLSASNSVASCIKKDAAGRLWIGTNNGLFLHDKQSLSRINADQGDSLKSIVKIFVDDKSVVWVYSSTRGLYHVYQPGIVFQTIPGFQAYSNNQLTQSILEEAPGVWSIGTRFGLYRYRFPQQKIEEINITGNPKNKPWIGAQLLDKNGGTWIGTFGQGVFYRAANENRFVQFTNNGKEENSLPINTIVALAEDKNGKIWMGSYNSGNQTESTGLCYYDPDTKKIYPVQQRTDDKAFKAISISQIEKDHQDQMWVGSWDLGLHHFEGNMIAAQQSAFLTYTENSDAPQKISHSVVSCIRPDRKGKLWIGTISGGINVLDTKTNTVNWLTTKEGLPSNLIYRMEIDDLGMVWASTDNGITRFDPATNTFTNYNTSSGLPANNFAFLTSMKCKDGTIAFGTNDGQVVYFNSAASAQLTNAQPVTITDIKLFNKSLQTGPEALLKKTAYLTDTLRLQFEHSVISFELSNMDYVNPEIFTYAYKLDGFDKDWTYITDRNFITYTNLNPGTYTLLLKNANHLGIWNETPTKLTLMIAPPYWRTWWFISLLCLLVAAVVYAVFKYRLEQKLKIFAVRNRIHRDLHDDVGSTLSSVKAYSEILRDNPDNPVIAELIKDNSSEMLDRLEVISWATDPHHDNLKSLKSLMMKFALPLCHARKIEFSLSSENTNEEMQMQGEVRQNLFLVFKEAINNMIKYAEATVCNTRLLVKDNKFIMEITDNGQGFDGTVKGTGNGTRNMKKRSEGLNGALVIESTPGKGSKIIVSFPYPFKIPNSWDVKKQ